jgi:hypothetical protein
MSEVKIAPGIEARKNECEGVRRKSLEVCRSVFTL